MICIQTSTLLRPRSKHTLRASPSATVSLRPFGFSSERGRLTDLSGSPPPYVSLGVPKYVKLEHKVVSAIWNEELGQWALKIERLQDGTIIEDFADVLVNASGILK